MRFPWKPPHAPAVVEGRRTRFARLDDARFVARRGMGERQRPQSAGEVDHFPLPVRRAEPSRHVRHEAGRAGRHPRAAQADGQQLRRYPDQRPTAAPGQGHGQGDARALHAPYDEEPQLGVVLRALRPRAAGGRHPPARFARPVSRLRFCGGQTRANHRRGADLRRVSLRHSRRLGDARAARQFSGQGTRPAALHAGPEQREFQTAGTEPAREPDLRAARTTPRIAEAHRRTIAPARHLRRRARTRCLLRQSVGDVELGAAAQRV